MRLTLLLALFLTHCLALAETLSGRVVRVTDGDTIVVLGPGNVQHKIRLTGIDAPERKQAFGTKSKDHLSDLVAGKSVDVDFVKRDRYRRILGKVLLNDRDMNLEQVKSGLAWHYKYYQKEQTSEDRALYSNAEVEAREAGRGLWRDPAPVPPWEYRRMKRK
ncbi:MAG: thermonuclease family protein [Gammaproteobacteria bacterium]